MTEKTGIHEPLFHGAPDFHLMVHFFETADGVRPHWHEEYEILMFTKGQGTMQINSSRFPFQEGTIIFIHSGAMHAMHSDGNRPFAFFAICFGRELLDSAGEDRIERRYIRPEAEGSLLFPCCIPKGSALWEKIHGPVEEIRDAGLSGFEKQELLVKSDLLRIWHCLASSPAPSSALPRAEKARLPLLKEILLVLQAGYAEDITLSGLAASFHMSEGQLCRFFRKGAGMTVFSYLNYYRMTVACDLLREGTEPVGQIAAAVGFRNISYFNRVFQRYLHCTPSEYRRSGGSLQLSDSSELLQRVQREDAMDRRQK